MDNAKSEEYGEFASTINLEVKNNSKTNSRRLVGEEVVHHSNNHMSKKRDNVYINLNL